MLSDRINEIFEEENAYIVHNKVNHIANKLMDYYNLQSEDMPEYIDDKFVLDFADAIGIDLGDNLEAIKREANRRLESSQKLTSMYKKKVENPVIAKKVKDLTARLKIARRNSDKEMIDYLTAELKDLN